MIEKCEIIELKLLAEVAIWMWQDFSMSIIAHISVLNVLPQCFHMVEPLLADEHSSTLEADLAKCLLMMLLQMPLQRAQVRKVLLVARAVRYEAVNSSESQT